LFLPSLVTIGINLGAFFLLYRKQLKGHFDIKRLPLAKEAIKHQAYFRYTCVVLALVAVAYVIASATQFPLSLVALTGTAALLIAALYWKRTTLLETGKRISWSIFGFIAGMVILVRSIEDTGLSTAFGNWLLQLSGNTAAGAVMVGTAGAALGTNLTTVGSLATVLWLLILRRRGIDVSGLDYFKVGVVVTPVMLLAGAVTIWLLL
jgi:arsenical pump membrane protein